MLNPASIKDQEMRIENLKMQDIMVMQEINQAQDIIRSLLVIHLNTMSVEKGSWNKDNI